MAPSGGVERMGRSRRRAEPADHPGGDDRPAALDRDDLGFLLAKAMQAWNELLAQRFAAAGYGASARRTVPFCCRSSRRMGYAWASWHGGRA